MWAYAATFSMPFVYDDVPAILENGTIRSLSTAANPPPGVTVSGRPLLNLSLALNYAISAYAVWSYHALNLAIHAGATALLFGIVRRTLRSPVRATRCGAAADSLAWAVAALWALHPLATESVTYVVQRAECLMGLCYLGTLYGFVRGVGSSRPGGWLVASIATCALGMLTKEVMVSAPVIVLLYDRTFVSGTWRDAWRQRRAYYCGLAATWLPLTLLVVGGGGNRGGSVGFGTGMTWWDYGLTQFEAVARYLGLSFWPRSLVFEYGPFLVTRLTEAVPFVLVVTPLVVGTVVALWRWPAVGFLGAWFFAMLAPTSLVPGTTQMIVEHRMYLSLAAVAVTFVLMLQAGLGRKSLIVCAALAVALGARTARRNADYRSEVALWSATVEARPENALAHCNLANALVGAGRVAEAVPHYETALRLAPAYPASHYDYGLALARLGRPAEALACYERAAALKPGFARAHAEAGLLLFEARRPTEAVAHYEAALRIDADDAETHDNLANALFTVGRVEAALAHYGESLRLRPADPETHYNFGNTLFQLGRLPDAVSHYEAALRARADFPDAHYNLGLALARLGRRAEAIAQCEQALALRADFTAARQTLAQLRGAP